MTLRKSLAICLNLMFSLALAGVVSSGANAQQRTPGQALVEAIGVDSIMSFPMHRQMLVFMRPLQEANKSRQQEVFEIFDKIVMPQVLLAFTAGPVKEQIAKYYDQIFPRLNCRN